MSRELLILRHAKSDWGTDALTDFERPLAKRGKKDAPRVGKWLRDQALVPDHVVSAVRGVESRSAVDAAVRHLEPGVTEVHVRPAIDTPELRAITPRWAANVSDAHLVTTDWTFRSALARSGAELIGFREVRRAQRADRGS